MAVTIVITTANGSTTNTVADGSSILVSPSARVQIVVNGVVIDPNTIQRDTSSPPDVTLTIGEGPDAQVITLLGYVDLE